jgi:hypothetical protein
MSVDKAFCPVCETEQPILPFGNPKKPAYAKHDAPCGLPCFGSILAAAPAGDWHGRPANEPATTLTATGRHCPRCGSVRGNAVLPGTAN